MYTASSLLSSLLLRVSLFLLQTNSIVQRTCQNNKKWFRKENQLNYLLFVDINCIWPLHCPTFDPFNQFYPDLPFAFCMKSLFPSWYIILIILSNLLWWNTTYAIVLEIPKAILWYKTGHDKTQTTRNLHRPDRIQQVLSYKNQWSTIWLCALLQLSRNKEYNVGDSLFLILLKRIPWVFFIIALHQCQTSQENTETALRPTLPTSVSLHPGLSLTSSAENDICDTTAGNAQRCNDVIVITNLYWMKALVENCWIDHAWVHNVSFVEWWNKVDGVIQWFGHLDYIPVQYNLFFMVVWMLFILFDYFFHLLRMKMWHFLDIYVSNIDFRFSSKRPTSTHKVY